MNLERSEDERRFETQQIEAALWDDDGPSSNPFAVALGLAVIVAIVALISLLWSIIEALSNFVRYGVNLTRLLFNMAHSVCWPAEAALEPHANALIALLAAIIGIFACRSLLPARSAIVAFARRGRT